MNGVEHKYVTLNGKVVRETYGNVVIDYFYDHAGRPYKIVVNDNGTKTTGYYALNQQGDVIAILDTGANVLVKYSYLGYGKDRTTWSTGTSGSTLLKYNALKYRGYYYDVETGFYYVSSRYYDPEIGRWINADSQLNTNSLLGFNLFAYCENNPVNKVDSTGHMAAETAVAATNWWNPAGWIAALFLVVEIVVVVVSVSVAVNETATAVKDTVEAVDNIVNTRDQSVYTLTDPNDGNEVKYVGRTNNPERRAREHKKIHLKQTMK